MQNATVVAALVPRHRGFLFQHCDRGVRKPLQQTVRGRQADDASAHHHDAHSRYDTAPRPVAGEVFPRSECRARLQRGNTMRRLKFGFIGASRPIGVMQRGQTPVVNAVVNSASGLIQGLPNAGIAQGAIFVVKGSNLGAFHAWPSPRVRFRAPLWAARP